MQDRDARIAVIGLGYVGLPLAVEFGRLYDTVGFDINAARVAELRAGRDTTGELDDPTAPRLTFSADLEDIRACDIYIVAVPTPIDANRAPDLTPLLSASRLVGEVISPGNIVIYESTVYPGATEDDCLPVVETVSGLTFNRDFFAGYSPERINPGDKTRPITKIVKVTSGSTPEVAARVDALYRSVIPAGTHLASSIRVAEAAKVIENTQRDVNIALINELSMVFSRLGIDTMEVVEAAATKWNFMRVQPGLVGGHCIGVDPYYLLHRSMRAGHVPDIIRMAREINDGMPREAARRLVRALIARDARVKGAEVLVLGATFKENCADVRNTKVATLVAALEEWEMRVTVHDPHVAADALPGLTLAAPEGLYDALVLAVPHREFLAGGAAALRDLLHPGGVFFDMKAAFPKDRSDLRL